MVGICWQCFHDWQDALAVLSGANGHPKACAVCRADWEELKRRSPGPDVRMVLHPKDGIAQFLCGPCSDTYERKRLDIYGKTPYGQKLLRAS